MREVRQLVRHRLDPHFHSTVRVNGRPAQAGTKVAALRIQLAKRTKTTRKPKAKR